MKRKGKKAKKQKKVLVTVSALALSASYGGGAFAQLQIACSQGIRFGNHAACANGSLAINPTGATSSNGCLLSTVAPQPGQCVLSTLGPGPTKNVKVAYTVNFINITNGTSNMKINNFLMRATSGTVSAVKATFTPAQVLGTVTINVGANMNYNDGQPKGNYIGQISITAN